MFAEYLPSLKPGPGNKTQPDSSHEIRCKMRELLEREERWGSGESEGMAVREAVCSHVYFHCVAGS